MIEEVNLVTVLNGKPRQEDAASEIALWPFDINSSVIVSRAGVYGYKFRLKVKDDISSVSFTINSFEYIEFSFVKMEGEVYVFESKILKYKSFLGFNLGISDYEMYINGDFYRLKSTRTTQSLLVEDKLEYMYECVSESDFFNLYVLNYSRGNLLASETMNDSSSYNFWLSIAIARNVLMEIKRFIKGELEFTNRVERESVVSRYNTSSSTNGDDIEWLMQNPNELSLSSNGNVLLNGLIYEISNISQSKMVVNFNTYENRLLLSCLYSIKVTFFELRKKYIGIKRFPHKSIDVFIESVSDSILKINKKLNLHPPFNETPDFSNKYLGDSRYMFLYSLITRWYATNTLKYGDDIRIPILGVTEIFEHYCFIKMTDCFINSGFKVDESSYLTDDEISYITLTKGDAIISIYYEPSVSYQSELPILNSKNMNVPYKPDFVITYKSDDYFRCGVIDAKFSGVRTVKSLLGKEIYYKYGLYFHKENHEPIDYVFAMFPSLNDDCEVVFERKNELLNIVKPSLGYFSVPFTSQSSEKISSFLLNMIVGNVSENSMVSE